MTYILYFQSLLRTEPKEFGLCAPTPAVHLTGIRFCQLKLLYIVLYQLELFSCANDNKSMQTDFGKTELIGS